MNKTKRMAIMKHRRKKKKEEEKKKALMLSSAGVGPAVKVALKEEREVPKPVKALAGILKPKESRGGAVRKAAPKKQKVEAEKKTSVQVEEAGKPGEKVRKTSGRKKTETIAKADIEQPEVKKTAARKKKAESGAES